MTVALGITTFNRPDYAEKCAKAIARTCVDSADYVYMYDDGSDDKFNGAYRRAHKAVENMGGRVVDAPENRGVAHAKNALLYMMAKDTDADWFILVEDDIKALSHEAIDGYVRLCERRGLHHLSYALHGPANQDGPVDVDDDISYYGHSIGAWTIFSRDCLEAVGGFDEHFVCAWEHVEHELRLIQAGFMPGADVHRFPDASASWIWLTEQRGSIEKSSIRPRPDWQANIRDGLIYWRDAKPETFNMLFGPSMPLHNYALSITGG